MRVLVVDDEDAARYLIASLLKGHGYEVIEAVDGKDALSKARSTDVDIIITDILMPTMDGYQLCREWKADDKLSPIPLVFYSATYTEPADERFATSLGADAFFVKPQEPDVLVALLEGVLRRHEEERIEARPADEREEADVLREYSERLVSKLEQTIVELKKSNTDLRSALEVLSDEVEVKSQLIAQLNEDLHRRDEEHRRGEEDYASILSVIRDWPMGVVALDENRAVTLANPEAERILGFEPGGLTGHVYSADEEGISRFFEIWRSGKAAPRGVHTYPRPDGSEIRFEAISGPSRDSEGNVRSVVVMLAEVDE